MVLAVDGPGPRAGDDELMCVVVVKQWRQRKCGPGHALLACMCFAHGGFQIYPLGWRRYGRVAVIDDGASEAASIIDDSPGARGRGFGFT